MFSLYFPYISSWLPHESPIVLLRSWSHTYGAKVQASNTLMGLRRNSARSETEQGVLYHENSRGLYWDFNGTWMGFHGIQWDLMGYSCDTHGIFSCDSWRFRGIWMAFPLLRPYWNMAGKSSAAAIEVFKGEIISERVTFKWLQNFLLSSLAFLNRAHGTKLDIQSSLHRSKNHRIDKHQTLGKCQQKRGF